MKNDEMQASTTVRVQVDPTAPRSISRLAVVFADPIRLKIVTELFRREMSPSQFYGLHGGGSVPRVDRHFKRLAEHGWVRLVREVTGGSRRGSTEHFYRAPELPMFDGETWATLPAPLKAVYSWGTLEEFAERVREALEAGTFDARDERHFTWTPLVLDELGRRRVLGEIDFFFYSLLEEQADARVRSSASVERPIHATVGLTAFDSPSPRRNRSGLLLPPASAQPVAVDPSNFTVRIAKVLGNSLNLKILTELSLREMSASQFFEEVGAPSLSDVNRRFKMLAKDGWLTKVREETGGKRRGAVERFYRAVGSAGFDARNLADVPDRIRSSFSWRVFEQLAEQVREAMDAGTFDATPDRHHTWTPLVLDPVGWDHVIEGVNRLFDLLFEEQEAAKARLATSMFEPVIATVSLAAFESPPGIEARPLP